MHKYRHLVAFAEREIGYRLLGDVSGNDDAVTDVHLDRTVDRAWLNGGDPTCDLVSALIFMGILFGERMPIALMLASISRPSYSSCKRQNPPRLLKNSIHSQKEPHGAINVRF